LGAREYYVKFGYYAQQTGSDGWIYLRDGAGTTLVSMKSTNLSEFTITGIGASGFTPVEDTWALLELRVIENGSSSTIDFYVDTYLRSSWTGTLGTGDGNGMKAVWLISAFYGTYDDFGINCITMRYDGGSGSAPAVGEVLTGAGGGSATVTHLISGDATSGVVMLHIWNETAFVDNEVLTGDVALVAVVNAPNTAFVNGFEPNSTFLGNTIVKRFVPTADGNSSQLTNSAGDSINNWSYVDDTGGADYVKATAAAQRDTYVFSVAAGLPTGCSVPNITAYTYAESVLTGIDGVSLVTRYSGTDYDSTRTTLTGSYVSYYESYDTRPDGDTGWDDTSAAAIEVGQVFVA
jgi:hypothetical protein